MNDHDACERWPEVEAADDGRYGEKERARVERHVEQCTRCQRRRQRSVALRAEARLHARVPVSELDRHRARTALLTAAAAGVEAKGPTASRRIPARVGAAVLVAACAGLFLRTRRSYDEHAAPGADATATVRAGDGAAWTRSVEPARETVVLREGALQVTVPHQRAGHRFLVALPDGELEVRGTRFVVEAHEGRTTRVTVYEGLVALRVAGGAERLLAAGGHWEAPAAPSPTVLARRPDAPTVPPPVPLAPSSEPAPEPARRRVEPSSHQAFQRFSAGVAAMGRGDFRVAAEAFEAFERQRPQDERAEDAAWLRVVALRRSGDERGAVRAGEHYLATYPAGAHRRDVEALLDRVARRPTDGGAR